MRPKLGSAPNRAVFTSGESATAARDRLDQLAGAGHHNAADARRALAVGHHHHRELAQQRVERLAERKLVG